MDTERNLLFGILAEHAGLIDDRKLFEALKFWNADPDRPLVDVLSDRGWIDSAGRKQVNKLVDRALEEHAGDIRAALAALLDDPAHMPTNADKSQVRRAVFDLLGDDTRGTVVRSDAAGEVGTVDLEGDSSADGRYAEKAQFPTGPRYRRTSLHASGGMGRVWLAHDSHVGRDVALKELRADVASAGSVPLRFLREAQITGQLEHPGVVPVYELGSDPVTGRPFYTMRFVRGRNLTEAAEAFHKNRQAGRDDPLELVHLLSAFVSVCNTVAYAHSHGIVHRDLKGENIILGDYGEVIVLDWGLAKRLDDKGDGHADADGTPGDAADELAALPGPTIMGQVMGTPAYMAPEQAHGQSDMIGPWTDIFGAGAILYEILTGRAPFAGKTTMDVVRQAQHAEVVPPREFWREVPADLEAACRKAMSKAPGDRYASASDLAREIQGWQDRQRRRAENELRQAYERLMQQQAALVALTRSEVFTSLDLIDIYRQMIEASAITLGVERVSVWRFTENRRAIRCHLLYELGTKSTSAGMELKADDFPSYFEALNNSQVIAAHDARTDPRTREFTEAYLNPLNIGAIMDAPIHLDGALLGVVCHENVGSPRKWLPDEQLFAIAIANLVSQAISQWEHRQELSQLHSDGGT